MKIASKIKLDIQIDDSCIGQIRKFGKKRGLLKCMISQTQRNPSHFIHFIL